MKLVLTLTGPQASGKTTWLAEAKAALLRTAPAEAIEIAMYEGDGASRFEMFDEFLIPDQPEGTPADGDQETYRIETGAGHIWAVVNSKADELVGLFLDENDARDFLAFKNAANHRQQAAMASLRGEAFQFDGNTHFIDLTAEDAENCRGGGGDFAEGAGAIPVGHFCKHEAAHAAHLADRLDELALSEWLAVNASTKCLQAAHYLRRIAEGAGVVLSIDHRDRDEHGAFYHHGIREGAE